MQRVGVPTLRKRHHIRYFFAPEVQKKRIEGLGTRLGRARVYYQSGFLPLEPIKIIGGAWLLMFIIIVLILDLHGYCRWFIDTPFSRYS